MRISPRARPVNVSPREKERLADAIEQSVLLAAEPADPVAAHAQPAHHAVDPFGRQPAAVAPVLLLDVEGVVERDVSLLEHPDVEIDVVLDRPEAVIADDQERCVGGQGRLDRADAAIDRFPELDQLGPKRPQLAFAPRATRWVKSHACHSSC